MDVDVERAIERAAGSLSVANALLVTAGEGFDVHVDESRKAPQMTPLLKRNPARAWGFFAARLSSCRAARPGPGLGTLLRWALAMTNGAFVFTSSSSGAFQRAGFLVDRLVECRGAYEWMQCTRRCRDPFPGGLLDVTRDARGNAVPPLPACPTCGALARPNAVLDDGDKDWDSSRAHAQEDRMNDWLAELRAVPGRKLVLVECAASRDADVRARGERVCAALGGTIVRIDEESAGPLGVQMEPSAALAAIDLALARYKRG